MEYAESEEGGARLRKSAHYRLAVQKEGSFVVPEVLPGKYAVVLFLNEGALGSGPSSTHPLYMRQIASLWHKFEVPDASGQAAADINLGNLVLNASP
jgi:hypothetical protein